MTTKSARYNSVLSVAALTWVSTIDPATGSPCLDSGRGVHYSYRIVILVGRVNVFYGKLDRNEGTVEWVLLGERNEVSKGIVLANGHNAEPTY